MKKNIRIFFPKIFFRIILVKIFFLTLVIKVSSVIKVFPLINKVCSTILTPLFLTYLFHCPTPLFQHSLGWKTLNTIHQQQEAKKRQHNAMWKLCDLWGNLRSEDHDRVGGAPLQHGWLGPGPQRRPPGGDARQVYIMISK